MRPVDLTIIPQAGATIPSTHLTETEIEHVNKDWAAYGHETIQETNGTWRVAFVHIRDGQPRVSSVMDMPRSAPPRTPAAARARMFVIDGGLSQAVAA